MSGDSTVQAQRLDEALAAYNSGDFDALEAHLADDIVWHVGGDHPLSGDYRGHQAVREYFDRVRSMTEGSMRLEPIEILMSAEHAGVFMRVKARLGERTLDTELAEAIRFDEHGHWVEYWALADEQDAVDAFWCEGS